MKILRVNYQNAMLGLALLLKYTHPVAREGIFICQRWGRTRFSMGARLHAPRGYRHDIRGANRNVPLPFR